MFPLLPLLLISAGIGALLSVIEKDYGKRLTDSQKSATVKDNENNTQNNSRVNDSGRAGGADSGESAEPESKQ